jgi:hypothetical protein
MTLILPDAMPLKHCRPPGQTGDQMQRASCLEALNVNRCLIMLATAASAAPWDTVLHVWELRRPLVPRDTRSLGSLAL